jgi:hypothetical protein
MRLLSTTAALCLAALAAPAPANEFAPMLRDLAETEIPAVLDSPVLIEAIRAQNAEHAGIDEGRIEELDAEWRAQVGAGEAPLIDAVLGNDAAEHLREAREASAGLFTEVFVMDASGLTVAASDVTSDYWQGDEAKWQRTFPTGEMHIGEIELDESTQSYQSQVSVAIRDPETREPIGAATFGVNVEYLQ